ncbi:MAG TPA: endonuclease domain-containing protein [Thermoanaerobaculia bacterium]|jgi:type I restriction enzyme R subunit|nr:endonuclease domain-containing protein [Thermoanaerobaculia bacterium]
MRPSPLVRTRAKELRQTQTPAEKAMWGLLREHRLEGLKFRRQYPIGIFIVDFCCCERRLVVELDGEVHDTSSQQAWDENRDIYLQQRGFKVLRFRNEAVFNDPDSILQRIHEAVR